MGAPVGGPTSNARTNEESVILGDMRKCGH